MISPYQAFPVTKNTVVGTLTDQPLDNTQRIVHLQETGDLTLNFDDGSSVTVTLLGGMDVVLDGAATTLTTTVDVLLS